MKLGLSLPVFTEDPGRPLGVAARAADLGFDGVFAVDHLFPPAPDGPDRPSLEVFSVLAAVAALQPKLTVGTLVARVTLRAPGMLARQAAAIAAMRPDFGASDPVPNAAPAGGMVVGLGTGDKASRPEHLRYGIDLPDVAERLRLLEETALALRALFSGRAWPGGEAVPPLAGPVLPPASPPIWIGGRSDAVLAIAARSADAWNGWGLDADGFDAASERLRTWSVDREVPPTWGGGVLVGEDQADLARLIAERTGKARGSESLGGVWTGTVDDLRGFGERLRAAGAAWCVVLPLGPEDRLPLIAEALAA